MKDICFIDIADGIGNVIQSIPFIIQMKKEYKSVIGHIRPDFIQSVDLVKNIYNGLVHKGNVPKNYDWYRIPNLSKMGSYPEYKSWFKFYNKEYINCDISQYINYNKSNIYCDIVLWGGCKPAWKSKQWNYWNDLLLELIKTNKTIGIVGLKNDGNFNILKHYKNVIDFRDKNLSLLDVGGIIKNTKIFIGNEGGISHYSAGLGTKTYILYGGTDPIKNMPPHNAIKISLNLDCQPCQFKCDNAAYGCGNYKCLDQLTVNYVLKYIKEDLK